MMKNKFRILVSFVLTFVLLLASVSAFNDIELNSDAGIAIMKMYDHGYIQGDGDGRFRPDDTLTRAEFVTIINRMYDYTVEAENIFTDISKDDWFYSSVLAGVHTGYIKGMDDGTFRPNNKVTREEVCVMLDRILKPELLPFRYEPADAVSEWARESVERLLSNHLFSLEDGGKFRATQPITRSEVCVALEKCIINTEIEIEPIDIESMAREELEKKLSSMIEIMEAKVIPACTYEKAREVAVRVTESMKKYVADKNYDYLEDAKTTYDIYRKSGDATKELKALIFENIETKDVAIMLEFFYTPEISNVK